MLPLQSRVGQGLGADEALVDFLVGYPVVYEGISEIALSRDVHRRLPGRVKLVTMLVGIMLLTVPNALKAFSE